MIERFAIAIFVLLFCTACFENRENNKSEEKQAIIGFSQLGSESSWRVCNSESIIKAAKDAGFQIIFDDAQQKQENQIKAIRSFIVYRVDVIVFAPIVETGWDTVLEEAREAEIPVIVLDRKIKIKDSSLIKGYIGEDAREEGRKAAYFLLDKYKDFAENSETTETSEHKENVLNILEVSGTLHSSSAKERAAGFREVIAKEKKFQIIYSESGDFLRSRGKEIISQIIAYNAGELKIGAKKIDIILSHNDAMTLGILDALDSYNIAAGEDVAIVSFDGEQKAIDELVKGRVNCIVECNPKTGDELLQLIAKVIRGEEIEKETYVAEDIFTENDNFSLFEKRGY